MSSNLTNTTQDENLANENNTAVVNLPETTNVISEPVTPSSTETNIESATKKKKASKPNIARNPYEKAQQAIQVAKLWMLTSYELQRFTAEQMLERAQQLLLSLVSKKTTKVQRNPLTTKLNALYEEASKSGSRVKAYLRADYDKTVAEAKYQEFGFIYSKTKGYKWPYKREEFLASLDIMQNGLETYGYADREFGAAYWADLKQRYEQVFADAGLQKVKWSVEIGTTEELIDEVHGMLVSVKKLVESENYGNETRALRNMGFMKEQN